MAFNWIKFPWTNLHDLNLDWIIQTVKTLEDNLADAVSTFREMIDTAISNTLTGSGDLTINKTGDVKISGRSVTIYPVKIPTDVVDIGEYAANCGFVSMEVENMTTMLDNDIDTERTERLAGDSALQSTIDTERTERLAGDSALQSTIDKVIMPLINNVRKRAPRVFYFSTTTEVGTLTREEISTVKEALLNHTPIMFVAYNAPDQYCYYLNKCIPEPTAENIDTDSFNPTFRTLDGLYSASLVFSGSNAGTVIFDTIS